MYFSLALSNTEQEQKDTNLKTKEHNAEIRGPGRTLANFCEVQAK